MGHYGQADFYYDWSHDSISGCAWLGFQWRTSDYELASGLSFAFQLRNRIVIVMERCDYCIFTPNTQSTCEYQLTLRPNASSFSILFAQNQRQCMAHSSFYLQDCYFVHAFCNPRVKPSMADSKVSKADGACAWSKEKDPFVRPMTTDTWR